MKKFVNVAGKLNRSTYMIRLPGSDIRQNFEVLSYFLARQAVEFQNHAVRFILRSFVMFRHSPRSERFLVQNFVLIPMAVTLFLVYDLFSVNSQVKMEIPK
jgi:hypothetical protein